jgi:hypothetical protein
MLNASSSLLDPNQTLVRLTRFQMTPPPTEPSKQPTRAGTQVSKILKFSKQQLALAFAIAGISDAIGAFATPLPPIVWVVDLGTALLLFMVLGLGAIAVLGTPRPSFERR